MDFFQHQEAARRRTTLLVLYYAVAVAAIIIAVYLAAVFAFHSAGDEAPLTFPGSGRFNPLDWWNERLFVGVAGITLIIVLAGTSYKILALREGGAAVARLLGGRLVDRATTDGDERRLLNVVEEMAIAAGMRVPPVYVLDEEPGLNAFAAGYSPDDAVVAVTRGSLEQLTRDELQGVIAHEFSHIFNGDMRLNVNLMGVLHGILVIGLIGYSIVRGGVGTGSGPRRRSSGRGEGGGGIFVFGLLIMVIGFIGVFFAKLIKSAVSRQREYLADASAVQYTRNPAGIGNALRKIAGSYGSRIRSPRAEEASHFYFADGLASSLLSLTATHPPVAERIRRIDASLVSGAEEETEMMERTGALSGFAGGRTEIPLTPADLTAQVGTLQQQHIDYAARLIAALPPDIRSMANELFGAQALLYSLLLGDAASAREGQLKYLEENLAPEVLAEVKKASTLLEKCGAETRLPLVDLALPVLFGFSAEQFKRFRTSVHALILVDNEVTLFEFALARILAHTLERRVLKKRQAAVLYQSISEVLASCQVLLSAVAHYAGDGVSAQQSYAQALSELKLSQNIPLLEHDDSTLEHLNGALNDLTRASAPVKKNVIAACAAAVQADGRVTMEEAEVLRAICESLDCPVPPLHA